MTTVSGAAVPGIGYRRELDGLRALAVLPVIFYHAGFSAFRGGFVGVDIFFVISGYLITSLIVSELQVESFSLLRFYERRARRILPALFLVMAVCIPVGWILLIPSDLRDFSRSLAAVSVFSSNILFWSESGYFDTAASLKPLMHTWSLAVEEQFYLLYPVCLLLAWKLGKKWTVRLVAGTAVASLALAHWGALQKPSATFFLLPTRGWELLIGALIAFRLPDTQYQPGRAVREMAGFLGLSLIAYAVFSFDETTPFPSLYALIPTIGTGLLIMFATRATTMGRVLGSRWLVAIGLVSYSVYLWHYPLFVFARNWSPDDPAASVFVLLSVAAIALASLSWRFVEQPFRRRAVVPRATVFGAAAAASTLFIVIGGAGTMSNGFYRLRLNDNQQQVLATAAPSPERARCHAGDGTYQSPANACEYYFEDPSWAVFGDSHAVELAHAVAQALRDSRQGVKHLTFAGCPPFYGQRLKNNLCSTWTEEAVDYITAHASITNVVVSYRILLHLFGEPNAPFPRPSNSLEVGMREAYWRSYVGILERFVQSGKRVYLVLQAPELPKRIEELIFRHESHLDRIDGARRSWWNDRSSFVRSRLGEIPSQVTVVDPAALFCDGETCAAVKDGVALYLDDDHMSVPGAALVAAEIVRNSVNPFRTGPQ